MNGIIKIEEKNGNNIVDARLLHKKLKIDTRFNDWILRRLDDLKFLQEGIDFYSILSKTKGRPGKEYFLTLDTAKHISMMENNEIGYKIRQYFINFEKKVKLEIQNLIEEKNKKILLLEEKINQPFICLGFDGRNYHVFINDRVGHWMIPFSKLSSKITEIASVNNFWKIKFPPRNKDEKYNKDDAIKWFQLNCGNNFYKR